MSTPYEYINLDEFDEPLNFDPFNYIKKISFFNNGHIMILCMTNEQAAKCIEFKYFEVDLSFKRVYGDINEFEFNAYEEKSRTILAFYIIFTNIATKEKSCCIYYIRNVDHYPYCADTKHDMLEILKANSSEEINQIFGQIKMRNEDAWYTKLARILSETMGSGAHAMINRTGKSLKLKIAILRGWKHNECIYKRIKIHQQTGIHMSSKDRSDFGKKMQANKRSDKLKNYPKEQPVKESNALQKKAKIDYDDDDTEMEIEERKIALEERKMQFKQNEIDLKLKELQIKKSEMELNNNQ
ncbi:unnamed protein product [Rhizophagus irregularis]|nr:unnamed protein product [Rhizophagus irregularis]